MDYLSHYVNRSPGPRELNILELLLLQSLNGRTMQCHFVVSKAARQLNCLCRTMFGCTQEAKANVHKALVGPYLEYACAVWNPYTDQDIALLESVQNRAVRWIKSYWDPSTFRWSKSSSVCIKEL